MTKRWWISWYCPNDLMGKFELHSPWWISGEAMEDDDGKFAYTICAAVQANDEEGAQQVIIDCHDNPKPSYLEWRFVEARDDDWSPFGDRFQKADWMQWPDAA